MRSLPEKATKLALRATSIKTRIETHFLVYHQPLLVKSLRATSIKTRIET